MKIYLSVFVFCAVVAFASSAWTIGESLQERTRDSRMPIRVGGNVMEAKLIQKVAPVYPDAAKAARIQGVVILQATVDEQGEVIDLNVLRGNPLLRESAVEAVRQWRYQPTLLNGIPVSVIATVTVVFKLAESPLVMDDFGNLRDPETQLEGPRLLQNLKERARTPLITPNPNVPVRVIEEVLRSLVKEGLDIQLSRGFSFFKDRLYFDSPEQAQYPVLALDHPRLVAIARGSSQLNGWVVPAGASRVLLYRVFMGETGEIHAVQQIRGPRIPEVEEELSRTRVVSPGLRGADPVAVAFAVEVRVDEP